MLDSQKTTLALSASKPHPLKRPVNESKVLIDLCSDAEPIGKESDTEEEESKVSAMTVSEYKNALEQISKSLFYDGISRADANTRLKWCLPNAKLVPELNDNQYKEKQVEYRNWLRRHMKQLK